MSFVVQRDFPPKANPTELHKAVFNGRHEKLDQLLQSGGNIYATTETNESLLCIAIKRNHLEIANRLIDIYEEDLKIIEKFFFNKGINNYFWLKETIMIAHGEEHIAFVQEISSDSSMIITEDSSMDNFKTGLIILLKTERPQILWLVANKAGDDQILAKIINCIYTDGIINMDRKEQKNNSILDYVAKKNFVDLFNRLLHIFGYNSLTKERFLELLCLFAVNSGNPLEYFKELALKIDKFEIREALQTDPTWNCLNYPLSVKQHSIFEYFLSEIAEYRMEQLNDVNTTKEQIISEILSTFITKSAKIYNKSIPMDLSHLAELCIKYKVDLISPNEHWHIALHTIMQSRRQCLAVGGYIIEHAAELRNRYILLPTIKLLVTNNWLDVLKEVYEKMPETKSIIPEHHYCQLFRQVLSMRAGTDDMIYELIHIHRHHLSDLDMAVLIYSCSCAYRYIDVLKKLLKLPKVNPTFRTICEEYKSAFYAALKYRKLHNFQLLLEAVTDTSKIASLKEEDEDNLLMAAIWCKAPVWPEISSDINEENDVTPEIIDEFDDEAEISRKTAFNKQIEESNDAKHMDDLGNPIQPMPEEYHKEEERKFNAIFDHLISIGTDYNNVNKYGENLIQVAVVRNNLFVLQKLLNLGVDPNVPGQFLNRPIHFVKSMEAFQLLLPFLPIADVINIVNATGETPLHTVCRAFDCTDSKLIAAMICNGANVMQRDDRNNGPLYDVANVGFAKILLEHGADLNTQNNQGESPLHRAFDGIKKIEVMKLFFMNENLNLHSVTKKGVSLLCGLVCLNDADFNEILSALLKRPDDLERLFQEQCNSKDHLGNPILHSACRSDTNKYCFDKLLSLDQLDITKHQNFAALAAINNIDALKKLIEKCSNSNEVPLMKPLLYAVGIQRLNSPTYVDAVHVLLQSGADPNVKDMRGSTALEYALNLRDLKKATQIIAALIAAGAEYREKKGENIDLRTTLFKCLFEV